MNPDLSKKAVSKIETLCEQGCSEVNQLLKLAKQGTEIKELTDFNRAEVNQIIDELEQIMSIYIDESDSDGCDDESDNDSATSGK